jgi:chloramphenicol 3-O-phosphotransferase
LIVWLNGTFGVGKTATAARLQPMVANSRLFDPETVGYLLRHHLADLPVTDFQHWSAWRPLVVATAAELTEQTGQHLIAPQTVLHAPYWQEIRDGLTARGIEVFHVLLDADETVLRQRVLGSDEAARWRLAHLTMYRDARPWMRDAADLVVDTGSSSPGEVARTIAKSLPLADG